MLSSKLYITILLPFLAILLSITACDTARDTEKEKRTDDFANYIWQYTDSMAFSRCNDSERDRYINAFHDDSTLFKCWIRDLHYDYLRRMMWLHRKAEIIHSLDSLNNRQLSNEEAVKNIEEIYHKCNKRWPVGAKYVMAQRYIEGLTETKAYLYKWEEARKKIEQDKRQNR